MLCFVIIAQANTSFGQTQKKQDPAVHDYYICLSGITTPADIERVENSIKEKQGVTFFQGDKYPVRYFILKTTMPLTQEEFNSWLSKDNTIQYFGEGIQGKEKAMLTYKKLRQSSSKN